jgi:hypothetical protein
MNGRREASTFQSIAPTDLPDGLIFRIRVKRPRKKYFAFTEIEIGLYAAPSRALEGRVAIVTNVVRDAMDVQAAQDVRGRCGRRNRVVLISRRWDQASRKTFRGERRWLTSPDTEESAYKP